MLNPILVSLVCFGAWISYFDFRYKQIKNYSVLLLILAAFFVNIALNKSFLYFPISSFLNVSFGILAAVVIWIAGLWSAADAKLFIAINFLFPAAFYNNAVGYFPGFSILVNVSVPLFFIFSLYAVLKTGWQEKKQALIYNLKPSVISHIILMISSLYFLARLISRFFNFRIEYLMWLLLLFVLFWLIERKFRIKMDYFCWFVIVLAAVLAPALFSLHTLIFIAIFSSAIFLFIVLVRLATPLYTQSVKIENLKEGMILGEMVIKEQGGYIKRPINFVTLLSLLTEKSKFNPVFGYNPDGLGKEGLRVIKSLHKENRLKFGEIRVSQTLPFAPILFAAGFLTYFFKGSFVYFLF